MQQLRRWAALLTCFAMLFGFVPFRAWAAEPQESETVIDEAGSGYGDYEYISDGESKDLYLDHEGSATYLFEAPDSLNYVFWTGDCRCAIDVYDAGTGEQVTGDDSWCWIQATAGSVYRVEVRNCYTGEPAEGRLYVAAETAPEYGYLVPSQETCYVGQEIHIWLTLEPANVIDWGNTTWTVSDGEIAELTDDMSPGHCTLRLNQAGEVTVEAYNDRLDQTLSVTVQVEEAVEIYDDVLIEPTMSWNEQVTYRYSCSESGTYVFWTDGMYGEIIARAANGDQVGYGTTWGTFGAEAGKDYYLTLTSWTGETVTCQMYVMKSVPVENGYIENETYTGYVGQQMGVPVIFEPTNTANRGETVWSVSDPDKVEFLYSEADGCQILLKEPGTVTVTGVNTEAGEMTTTVEILEAASIVAEEPMEVTVSQDSRLVFSFVPDQSDDYCFWFDPGPHAEIRVFDRGWNEVGYGTTWGAYYAEGGEQYFLELVNYGEELTGELAVMAAVPVTGAHMYQDEYFGFAGDNILVNLISEPKNTVYFGTTTWTVSDENVAEVVEQNPDVCHLYLKQPGTITVYAYNDLLDETFTATVTVEERPQLSMGANDFSLEPWQEIVFDFCAVDEGLYVIWDETENYTWFRVHNENGEILTEGNNWLTFYLEAGQPVTVYVINDSDEYRDYHYLLDYACDVGSIAMDQTEISGYTGQKLWVGLNYEPWNADRTQVQWTSSDEDVVRIIEPGWWDCGVLLVGEGEATLTATVGDMSVECQVTVTQAETMEIGVPLNLTLGDGEWEIYNFTAEESGDYVIWDANHYGHWIVILDDSGNQLAAYPDFVQFYAEAGRTYSVRFENYSGEDREFLYCLDHVAELEALALTDELVSGYVGQKCWVVVDYTPGNAARDELVWTSSDENVAVITDPNGNNCGFLLVGEGEATITVSCNGISASCQVVANGTGWAGLDEDYVITVDAHSNTGFRFTAPEAGEYIVWDQQELYNGIDVFNRNGDQIGGGNPVWFYAEEGETLLIIGYNDHYEAQTFNYRVSKVGAAASIELTMEDTNYYAGLYAHVNLHWNPEFCNTETVTWSVSDESILELQESNDWGTTVHLLSSGTATVTAVTESGLEASIDITVREPDGILNPGDCAQFTLEPWDTATYLLEVPEDDQYILWSENEYWASFEIRDTSTGWMDGGERYMRFDGWMNGFYLVTFANNSDETREFSYRFDHVISEAEELVIHTEYIEGYAGEKIWFGFDLTPFNADRSQIVWTSSNEDVARVENCEWENASVLLVGEGEATITATVNGVSASFDVVSRGVSGTFGPNEEVYVEIPAHSRVAYYFTTEESGDYFLWDTNNFRHGIMVFKVGDGFMGNGNPVLFYAEAGETYIAVFENGSDEDQTIPFMAAMPASAEGLYIEQESVEGYPGENYYVELNWNPVNCYHEMVTWTSSDDSVVAITNGHDWGADYELVGPGTATITVESESGWTDSFEVTVHSYGALTMDEPVYIDLEPWQNVTYLVTIPEDGSYIIWDENTSWRWIEVFDSDNFRVAANNNTVEFDANAGETYRVVFSNDHDEFTTLVYHLSQTAPVEEIRFEWDDPNGSVGQKIWMNIHYTPMNASRNDIVWTSSDESVAQITDPGTMNCGILLVGEGSSTITVTVGGISASVEVEAFGLNGELFADQVCDMTIEGHSRATYTFTAPADGNYTIWDLNWSYHNIEVYNDNGDFIAGGHPVWFDAEEGRTYTVIFYCDHWEPMEYSYMIAPTAGNAEGIFMGCESIVGKEGQTHYVELFWNPTNSFYEDVTWTSSDENVVIPVNSHIQGTDLYLVGPGTATITATSSSGLTATCTVEVQEMPSIEVGSVTEFVLSHDEVGEYRFVAPETGSYTIWDENSNWQYLEIMRDNGEYTDGNTNYVRFHAQEGEVLVVWINNWTGEDLSYSLHIEKNVTPESISLHPTQTSVVLGETVRFQLDADPINADLSDVVWSVSDESVLEIVNVTDNFTDVMALAEGTAELHATLNGETVSMRIIVVDPEYINAGYAAEAEIAPREMLAFRFTPEISDDYMFWDENFAGCIVEVFNQNGEYINGWENHVLWYAEAGTTYEIRVYNAQDQETRMVSIKLDDTQEPESYYLSETDITMFEGDWGELYVNTDPINSVLTDEVTWSTSDDNIVAILETEGNRCRFELVGAGSATITANVGGHTELVCQIISRSVIAMEIGQVYDIPMDGDSYLLTFTAPEEGEYVVWGDWESWPWIDVFTSDFEHVDGMNIRVQFHAEEGESFQILVSGGNGGTAPIQIASAVPLEKLVCLWDGNYINIPMYTPNEYGTYPFAAVVLCEPMNADTRGITMSADNDEVALLGGYNPNTLSFELLFIEEGEVNLHVEDAPSGESLDILVMAQKPINMMKDVHYTVMLDRPEAERYMKFTPEESGLYRFHVDSTDFVQIQLRTEYGELIAEEVMSNGWEVWVTAELEAGVTYNVICDLVPGDYDYPETGEFSVWIEDAPLLDALELIQAPMLTEYVDGFVEDYLEFYGLILEYTIDGETYTWNYNDYGTLEYSLNGFTIYSHVEGNQVILSCGGQSVSYEIDVRENNVSSIEIIDNGAPALIEGADGVSYYEPFPPYYYSLLGVVNKLDVKITYTDGTSEIVPYVYGANGYSFENNSFALQQAEAWGVGEHTITISYLGASAEYTVKLIANNVDRIVINQAPTHVYTYEDEEYVVEVEGRKDCFFQPLDLTGLRFTVHYTDGSSETFDYTDLTATDLSMNGFFAGDYLMRVMFAPDQGYYPVWIHDGYPLQICYAESGVYQMLLSYKGVNVPYTVVLCETPLEIVTQPEDVTVAKGEKATVTVEAEGEDLTYQWYYKEANGSKFYLTTSFTSNTYSVSMTDARNGRQVYCVITDKYGNTVQTETVTLSMATELKIVTQPEDVTVLKGEKATVTVEAEGEELSYQWYYKEASGSKFYLTTSFTSNTYSVSMTDARNGRQVYCVITDKYGKTVQTDTVTLNMAAELKIVTQPEDVTAAEGETARVTVEATGDGLTYKWYFKNADSTKFTLTTSFTGPTYSLVMNDARAGRQVYCVITDEHGNSVQTDTVTLSMGSALEIVTQPKDVTVASGKTAKVTVEATGDGLTYAWYFKNAGASKFTLTTSFTGPTYSLSMNASRSGRQVYCVITDQYGNSVTTNTVTLNMATPLEIVVQPEDVTVAAGETATVSFQAEGDGLTYKWYFKNASASKFSLTSTFTGNTYTTEMTEARDGRQIYCVVTDKYGNSVTTNTVTLNMGSSLKIVTQPSDVTVASGKTAKVTVVAQGDGLTYKWYYKNAGASKFSLTTSFTGNYYSVSMTSARSGRQVYCVITDKYGNSVTTETVTLNMGTELKIITQPSDVTVASGKTAKVTVVAQGDGLTYKWYYKNAGASKFSLTTSFTGTSYSVSMTSARSGRQVYCVITDQYGNSVTTDTVTLSMK